MSTWTVMTGRRSTWRWWSIKRPTLFVVVSVRHPKLPTGALGVVIPSALVYAGAWVARACLNVAPRQAVRGGGGRELPVDARTLGRYLVKFAGVLLCSGSYVLCDVRVPEERLRLRIRLV